MSNFLSLVLGGLFAAALSAQSLAPRVLVIYNTHAASVAESQDVAVDYQTKRGIPGANLCGVSFPDNEQVTLTEWTSTYRPALRACLDSVGRSNILYVVMSYKTPFRLVDGTKIASLDSYIADIWDAYSSTNFPSFYRGNHRYYADAQTLGNRYPPFQTFAAFRAQPRATLIYSVWRLDAASVALAKGLVTKALAAEAAGGVDAAPAGTVYVDRRFGDALLNNTADFSYYSGDHELNRMAEFAAAAGLTVVKDTNDAEIGVAPAPLTAPNAMLFCGWYQLLNYNNVFGWKSGAVGWHLDSGSATHPRTGPSWSAQALLNGITVTSGAITEPGLSGLAHADVVTLHLLAGGNVGDAFLRGTPGLKWMILNMGDPLYVPFPGGRPLGPAYSPDSLTVSTTGMVTGTASATLTLRDPAPAGGITVNWTNNWTPFHVTAVPATTTISAGQRTSTVSFTVTTPVANPNDFIGVVVTANYSSKSVRNSVLVTSLLADVSLNSTLTAGASAAGGVVLNLLSPLGGTVVTLTSSHPGVLQVPASVTVAAGAAVGLFTATTTAGSVAAPTPVTITATTGPFITTRVVTVNP